MTPHFRHTFEWLPLFFNIVYELDSGHVIAVPHCPAEHFESSAPNCVHDRAAVLKELKVVYLEHRPDVRVGPTASSAAAKISGVIIYTIMLPNNTDHNK